MDVRRGSNKPNTHDLQVTPWRRFGQDRLYVNLPDGRSAAWFDRRTSELALLIDVEREKVLAALAPYLPDLKVPQPRVSAEGLPPQDAVPADGGGDLAANPPGAALAAKLAELRPGFWRGLVRRLLRRGRPETESWRKGLAGERMVAAELDWLTTAGWRVLHSIPLSDTTDIDHLLIGPGGVFSVNTKYHQGSRIWVGDEAATVNGRPYPHVRKSRAEAQRASRILTRACGFEVAVAGVLAFVEADTLKVTPSLRDVYANHHTQLADAFAHATGVWSPDRVERIYTAARDRRTWLPA
ncbi:Nuclease-like protein [Frankia sp. AiPs1]|uniref:nuclease-related domain-containing protein n=1 Tax=Frankia sp. AiPa1 TaxID=573492 RepID=UPI00202AC4AA|nr:nuclease-related domain-containing protein [Frankia sp. AiPa1]MCL9761412.1 NERD domain-containing protein [Frankia sp. AiPa1]